MKTYFLSVMLITGGLHASSQQGGFTLKGKVKDMDNGKIYLGYLTDDRKYVRDSSMIRNGAFEFKGVLKDPVQAVISSTPHPMNEGDSGHASIFLDPAPMTVVIEAGNFKGLQIQGSATQDDYTLLQKMEEPVRKEMEPAARAYDEANMAYINAMRASAPETELNSLKNKADVLHEKLSPYYEKFEAIDMTFIKSHPDSYVAAYFLRGYVSRLSPAGIKELYNHLSDRVKNSSYGTVIQKEIKELEQGSPGSLATMFSKLDINGQPFNLADYKGKYILVDFWASWCAPCRHSNPHLLSLYSKYKDKGFEIVCVSDDDSNPDAWKKAVAQDHTGMWKHVLRGLKMTKTGEFDTSADISQSYGIHTLPTKILIDKDGMIIGRYGGGGEDDGAMDKKLEEIFGS